MDILKGVTGDQKDDGVHGDPRPRQRKAAETPIARSGFFAGGRFENDGAIAPQLP